MFLSTVDGRYWVELYEQVLADWEGLRMNHAVGRHFQQARGPGRGGVRLPPARFFSLRDRNADPVSTAMTRDGRVEIGVGHSNRSPFPQYRPDYAILARKLGVDFTESCYPYGR